MAHSKRNTSLPHFTSYERTLLRSTWGSKRSHISRDSFLPFASCRLCLQPARAPVVACATNGDLFCRECAISDLLAQRQEIKRLEREREEARIWGLRGGKKRKVEGEEVEGKVVEGHGEGDGKRRKVFELDMAQVAREEQERLKKGIKKEKVVNLCTQDSSKSALPSFWVPSLTPSTDHDEITANKAVKLTPMCPGSNETHTHSYSLKSLVDVHFTEEKDSDGTVSRVCPSCKKNLSNGLKAMLTKPCGHVICSPCVTKFMTPHDVPDPHASKEEQAKTAALHGLVLCYVCETDITPNGSNGDAGTKKKSKKKEKDAILPGLVEISSEGTGFAGGGGNVVTKSGVAFQC
ncbi:uncharacterized protein N7496_008798 [Penicillium cataractarum]|uniref:RING-type domain-containing protein n=1 Tax=Penicillium cataractarum TaxID=2100454 RepID=A0A9W9V4W1_9EURO|nr:uncharacterized protein N7496_008798 [Penicillium cataractarum]KAJ5369038.1 hypothetical protein N7496_008798 [Penicillium cataractarum]